MENVLKLYGIQWTFIDTYGIKWTLLVKFMELNGLIQNRAETRWTVKDFCTMYPNLKDSSIQRC
jgi:hypothetical protein